MTENEFWLEIRAKIMHIELIDGYCDWIEPKAYYLGAPKTIIEGKIGFLNNDLEVLKFKLTFPKRYENLSEIEWNKMISAINNSNWLYLNGDKIEMFI